MPRRVLPQAATLRYLKLEAKRFLKAAHAADDPRGERGPLKLAEAQRLLAREYGFASWALLKLRVAELEFERRDGEQQRAALIDAVCAWGWDHHDVTATADLADALVQAAPKELLRGDFLLACISGELEAVQEALGRTPTLATTPVQPRGWLPLVYVSYSMLLRKGDARAAKIVDIAKLLLTHGADPNAGYTSGEHRFPALYASIAVSQNAALTALLLERGADPNDGQSLYHAAERFETETLELLFRRGLDPASLSYCLLHKIDFQHLEGIHWFLDHGADPNAQHPRSHETALHWAIKRASPSAVIELLLARGANPDLRTLFGHTFSPAIRGWTALDLAKRLARTDLVAILRARGAAETPPTETDALVYACLDGTGAITRAQVAQLSLPDRALVAHLAQQNQNDAVERLLELGWPIDVPGWMEATPLHWAACRGNSALARVLLARGAPLTADGGYFKTPLHAALYCRWNAGGDYVGVLQALVAAGAVLPPRLDATGSPALDAAIEHLRSAQSGSRR
jgi:ankyrin repeat protein